MVSTSVPYRIAFHKLDNRIEMNEYEVKCPDQADEPIAPPDLSAIHQSMRFGSINRQDQFSSEQLTMPTHTIGSTSSPPTQELTLSTDKETSNCSSVASSKDNLVCVKHGLVPLVLRNASKIIQLFGVQLVSVGTRTDLQSRCDYLVFRMEALRFVDQPAVVIAKNVQVSRYLIIYIH